jgi:hypothetical protein
MQLIQGLTGGTESPRSRNMAIGHDFIWKFRKYDVVFKNLKVEDVGNEHGILLALLREALPMNSLKEIEIIPNPKDLKKKNTKEITILWISLAELLLHSRDSLEEIPLYK